MPNRKIIYQSDITDTARSIIREIERREELSPDLEKEIEELVNVAVLAGKDAIERASEDVKNRIIAGEKLSERDIENILMSAGEEAMMDALSAS
jgi:hypothetical protein